MAIKSYILSSSKKLKPFVNELISITKFVEILIKKIIYGNKIKNSKANGASFRCCV